MDNIIIRDAQHSDIEALSTLIFELFSIEEDFTPDLHKQKKGLQLLLESKSSKIFVAVASGRVIGMCSLQKLISTAEGGTVGLIEDMIVNENYRGKKIGSKLLTEIEKWSQENGILRLQLLADRENHEALSFYKSMKWQFTQLICLRKK